MKKIISLMLVLAMVLALAPTALANPVKDDRYYDVSFAEALVVKTEMSGNGGNATLNLTVGDVTRNVGKLNNNKTTVYPFAVNGKTYQVSVAVSGNAVVDIFIKDEKGAEVRTIVQVVFNDVGFHCGTFGGNGRVWPAEYISNVVPRDTNWVELERLDSVTWRLRNSSLAENCNVDGDRVICPQCGYDVWVSFSNQSGVPDGKNVQLTHIGPASVVIAKTWLGADGEVISEPAGATLRFYIFSDEDMNVLAGGPYSVEDTIQIAPGTYWIWEDPSSVPAGYSVVAPNPQKIISKANTKLTVTFTNQKNADELASLIFEKKVAGKNIVEWLTDSGYTNVSEILAGLEFYLDGPNGNYGPVTPGPDGKVVFTNLNPGTYTLSEEVVGAAAGIFTKMADISDITVAAGEQPSFTVLGGTVKKVIEGADIEDSDLFTLINGWGQFDWGYGPEGIGYPGLNSTGHIFYIGIRNTRTDEVLHSYCANAGSTNFAEGYGQYKIANSLHEIQWQQAFNYINDTYGDLNENRVITQIVTWALLGAVDVYSDDFENTRLSAAEKAAIIDVMENYEGYIGSGSVVDVLFLTSIYYNGSSDDFATRQPQIVPIFGTFYVENGLVD